jgi:hypothetical protein
VLHILTGKSSSGRRSSSALIFALEYSYSSVYQLNSSIRGEDYIHQPSVSQEYEDIRR